MPIWVTVITGFLGSGKTTLLNALLRHPGVADVAVIVNEFGEIGVDSDLMTGSAETMVQLANGCLCCSVKGELIDTFRDLAIQRQAGVLPRFDRVVIETTGIADPGPVLQIILTHPMVRNAYALDGVVTTVDAVNGLTSLANFPESVRQVAVADRIVLTKADLPETAATLPALRAELRRINPAAPIIAAVKGRIDAAALLGTGVLDAETGRPAPDRWINPDAYAATATEAAADVGYALPEAAVAATYAQQHHAHDENGHNHADVQSFCVTRDEPIPLDTLRLFLDAIAREAGPDLLRVKGLIHTVERPNTPAVVQGAQQIFHSLDWLDAWPTSDRRSRIVFITRGIPRAHIEDSLALIERVARRTARAAGRGGRHG